VLSCVISLTPGPLDRRICALWHAFPFDPEAKLEPTKVEMHATVATINKKLLGLQLVSLTIQIIRD
jgi:hypothetical protein